MEIRKINFIGIIFAAIIIGADFLFFRDEKIFYFLIGISFVVAGLPFILFIVKESGKEKEREEMFLEFSRNLVESVRAGTPISKSIINIRGKNYGSLTPYVEKLANQVSLGIPVRQALEIFANSTKSKSIIRAVSIIREAENAGGNIEDILESVANSASEISKLKKERKTVVYEMVMQGYIIFMIFIVIMLIMEFKIIPMTTELSGSGFGLGGVGGVQGQKVDVSELSTAFLVLLIVQGFFIGLVIGKLAEGSVKSGIKHSFILIVLAILISTGVRMFF